MVKEIQYTSIRRVLDNLMDHPLLRDLNLEQVVRHVVRFIGLNGYTKLYQDKVMNVEIRNFRGELPCDLISIIQVKDLFSGICLRSMTDNFVPGLHNPPPSPPPDLLNNVKHKHRKHPYIPPTHWLPEELSFKTQGRIIYTSFPEGCVEIAYKAIPVDEDGYPLLIDNENYLAALEAYIKKQVFTVKFETGKISQGILQNAQQEYAFLAAELKGEFTIPSVSEFEAISRSLTAMIPRMREFDNGFRNLGDREYLRRH